MPDLLIELFSEEIPARMQAKAASDLQKLVTNGLVDAGLTYAGARAFSTPRRLTLALSDLLAASPATREERKGPKADAPEKALEGFLRSTGLTRDQLEVRETKKGDVLFAVMEKPGRPASEIVAEVLEATIRNFPWPKSMRWGNGTLRWVRPLHSILCVMSDQAGAEIVPLDVDGITSGDTTEGHRFLAPGSFSVTSLEDYEVKLKRAKVVLNAEERADAIWSDATNQAFALGLEVVEDKGLLAEVAGLVEWPVVLLGEIGADFLDLPPEVLQTSMKEHQKFFSVKDKDDRIVRFVTVANTETADHGATILAGNQKVLAARLADAKFFWENDLRVAEAGAAPWLKSLENVTFHNKLGSQAERIDRIAALAREIAPLVGAEPDLAEQAARFAKADLSSEMVYEFPELQGLMGKYYAGPAGHPVEVAEACVEHYQPLGPSDDVPSAPVSVAVALADKLDTLTGFWAIDEKPTGSKDPFALRRAALGVIRLVLENGVRVGLGELVYRQISEFAFFGGNDMDLFYSLSLNPLDFTEALRNPSYERISDRYLLDGVPPNTLVKLADLVEEAIHGGKVFARHSDVLSTLETMSKEEKDSVRKFLEKCEQVLEGHVELPDDAIQFLEKFSRPIANNLLSFFHDRLKVFLKDRGIRHDVIDACLSLSNGAPDGATPQNDDLTLLVKRAEALSDTLKTEDGVNLIQGYKRAANILGQAEAADGVEYSYGADVKFAETDAEVALFEALDIAEAAIAPAIKLEDFATAMTAMAGLRAPIDAFFDSVQVNADTDVLRRNRLNLLHRIRATCGQVADLTKVEG
ncbi:MAG: glycyl-tRNA synthetase beta chain [Dinoroseobacter sp.]|jgi:glycyl-tRNA synthetase beta chain